VKLSTGCPDSRASRLPETVEKLDVVWHSATWPYQAGRHNMRQHVLAERPQHWVKRTKLHAGSQDSRDSFLIPTSRTNKKLSQISSSQNQSTQSQSISSSHSPATSSRAPTMYTRALGVGRQKSEDLGTGFQIGNVGNSA
jgi:hypothetical protein